VEEPADTGGAGRIMSRDEVESLIDLGDSFNNNFLRRRAMLRSNMPAKSVNASPKPEAWAIMAAGSG
jgi:hypothetical protein